MQFCGLKVKAILGTPGPPDCTTASVAPSTAPSDVNYVTDGHTETVTIQEFTNDQECPCPLTYSMSIDNSVGNNFITFDASTREVTIFTADNQYGDTTFAVTITGTNSVGVSTSLTFNIITQMDCPTITAPDSLVKTFTLNSGIDLT